MDVSGGNPDVIDARDREGLLRTAGLEWGRGGGLLYQLNKHAVVGLRVEKPDQAGEALARLVVDHFDAELAGALELGRDIVGLEGDMVQVFAALIEKPGHAGIATDGLDNLDLPVAGVEQNAADPLIFNHALLHHTHTQDVTPERQRLLDIRRNERHVVDPLELKCHGITPVRHETHGGLDPNPVMVAGRTAARRRRPRAVHPRQSGDCRRSRPV